MKDSGVEWIGDIPEGWTCEKLKFRAEVNAQQLASTTASDYYFDYVDISSVTYGKGIIATERMTFQSSPSRARRVVQENDIIIGTVRTYLKAIAKIPSFSTPIIASTGFAVIRPSRISCQFLYYVVQSDSFIYPIISHSDGVSYPSISENKIFNIKIPIPSEIEQQRIADFLDTRTADIDASIAKTQESIEEYKKLKQAVITQAVTKGIRPGRAMKDSGVEWIGEIPEEWEVMKAGRIIESTQNGLTRRDLAESRGNIVLKLKNITPEGTIDYSSVNRISLTEQEQSAYRLKVGDFLFVRVNGSRALVGKCAVFSPVEAETAVAYNDHIIRVRLNDIYDKSFFQRYLMGAAGRVEIDLHTATAAGQYTISGQGLRDILIVYPPLSEQHEIAAYLDEKCAAIDTLIEKKQAIITELEAYKKSLIYEYVTGKKEVPMVSC